MNKQTLADVYQKSIDIHLEQAKLCQAKSDALPDDDIKKKAFADAAAECLKEAAKMEQAKTELLR